MHSPAISTLASLAARLPMAAGARALGIPNLIFVTDPQRTPRPEAIAERLPAGAGVIYRSFGDPKAVEVGQALAAIARANGLILLIGADPELAGAVGADGVHLPQRLLETGPRLRRKRPDWLLTGAAHDAQALRRAAQAGLDAALLSPVFGSRSPSARAPLGPLRFNSLCKGARLPVIALGGVDQATAKRLLGVQAAGIAAVEAFLEEI